MPPAKKRKVDQVSLETTSGTPTVPAIDAFFDKLLSQIDDGSAEPLYTSLLQLKAWQQNLLVNLEQSQTELEQAWKKQERHQRAAQALDYEEQVLDADLEKCSNFKLEYLTRLVRDELQQQDNTEATDMDIANADTTSKENPQEEATELLTQFLGANVHDPNDKQTIVARLHQEVNSRGGLERDLKLKQKELQRLEQELQTKQGFLQSLPDHLASVERASLPLQKFMAAKSSSSNGENTLLIGTERQKRLHLAQSLPPPLYTLFQQIQHCLDRPRNKEQEHAQGVGVNQEKTPMSVSIATAEADPQVLLQIPVPASTGKASSKRVSVHFYYSAEHNLVSAVASGCSSLLLQDVLLEELFPNDTPLDKDGITGRPYLWCNYMSGLHLVPQQQRHAEKGDDDDDDTEEKIGNSTRVILQELQCRVRANATLKHILQALQRQHVPGMKRTDQNTCKLVKFSAKSTASSSTNITSRRKPLQKTFQVQLQGRDEQYHAQVCINMARYPKQPPVWNLNPSPEGCDGDVTNETPLYNAELSALEHQVNVTDLDALVQDQLDGNNGDGEEGTDANKPISNESAYENILLYQLRYIMEKLSNKE